MQNIVVEKDYLFSEIAEIYDIIDENFNQNWKRQEVLERLASMQNYVKHAYILNAYQIVLNEEIDYWLDEGTSDDELDKILFSLNDGKKEELKKEIYYALEDDAFDDLAERIRYRLRDELEYFYPWKVFTLNDKELVSYSIEGTFDGEELATKELLAHENNCSVDDIKVKIEYR